MTPVRYNWLPPWRQSLSIPDLTGINHNISLFWFSLLRGFKERNKAPQSTQAPVQNFFYHRGFYFLISNIISKLNYWKYAITERWFSVIFCSKSLISFPYFSSITFNFPVSQHKGADNKSLMQQTFPEAPKPTDFSLWSGYGTTCIHNYLHYGSTSAQKCGFAWFLLDRQHFAFVVVCKEWLTANIIGKKWSNLFIFTWIKLLCMHLIYLRPQFTAAIYLNKFCIWWTLYWWAPMKTEDISLIAVPLPP